MKLTIVKFKNGKYAIRKKTFLGKYMYLGENNLWYGRHYITMYKFESYSEAYVTMHKYLHPTPVDYGCPVTSPTDEYGC